jgi:hypothetical protein
MTGKKTGPPRKPNHLKKQPKSITVSREVYDFLNQINASKFLDRLTKESEEFKTYKKHKKLPTI